MLLILLQVSSKVLLNKWDLYLLIISFVVHLESSKGYEIAARDRGASFYYLSMPVILTQYRGVSGDFQHSKEYFSKQLCQYQ